MADASTNQKQIAVNFLKGLNERIQPSNPDAAEFSTLLNTIPTHAGGHTRINGAELLQKIDGHQIWGICQTNNSRKSILIQTDQALMQVDEDFFFNRPYTPNLTPAGGTIEEEDMSLAILVHTEASGTSGGALAAATDTQHPITHIAQQLNPDGTAAAFCTIAAGQFTLAAGQYRIEGWVAASNNTANAYATGKFCNVFLYNITTAAKAWAGLQNENGNGQMIGVSGHNERLDFGGVLSLGVSTTFEIRQRCTHASAGNEGMGKSIGTAGYRELYAHVRILKTA